MPLCITSSESFVPQTYSSGYNPDLNLNQSPTSLQMSTRCIYVMKSVLLGPFQMKRIRHFSGTLSTSVKCDSSAPVGINHKAFTYINVGSLSMSCQDVNRCSPASASVNHNLCDLVCQQAVLFAKVNLQRLFVLLYLLVIFIIFVHIFFIFIKNLMSKLTLVSFIMYLQDLTVIQIYLFILSGGSLYLLVKFCDKDLDVAEIWAFGRVFSPTTVH